MVAVAIIPARGGSKGIPGKNLRSVGGIPLVARSIRAALSARRIDAVFVSSDSDEILNCARQYGAGLIRRAGTISGDQASSESALLAALDDPGITVLDPEVIVMIQCTSPFTRPSELDALVEAFDTEDVDAALTVIEDHGFLWGTNANGFGHGINHDITQPRQRRQDLEPQFRETGAAYAMRVDAFRATGQRFCGNVRPILTGHPPFEVDTPQDLAMASALAGCFDDESVSVVGAAAVRALVMDFDGVHTDDRVIVREDGVESVRCSRSDGMGIERLIAAGIPALILSKEVNSVVARRAEKLKLPVIHGKNDKLEVLRNWAADNELNLDEICYVGNDVNDLPCMKAVGWAVAPANANAEALAVADHVLTRCGGDGAVRELCEILLASIESSTG